jgi:hypothetical protein
LDGSCRPISGGNSGRNDLFFMEAMSHFDCLVARYSLHLSYNAAFENVRLKTGSDAMNFMWTGFWRFSIDYGGEHRRLRRLHGHAP